MIERIGYLIAIFFGAGLAKKAPGTVGSLASLIIWIPLFHFSNSLTLKVLVVLFIFLLGIWASQIGMKAFNKKDPKQVVIDEVAGQGLALILVSATIPNFILGFLLFRFFDILKPWPISLIDKKMHSAFGIMFDDIIAGLFALVSLYTINYFGLI